MKLNRYIEKGTLLKRSFEFEELLEIRQIQDAHRGLSLSDCSSVFLSTELSATLLTGDAVLRRAAEKNGIRVHGILWVFEELVGRSLINLSASLPTMFTGVRDLFSFGGFSFLFASKNAFW